MKIMLGRVNGGPTSNTRCEEMWDPLTIDEVMVRVMSVKVSKTVGSFSEFSDHYLQRCQVKMIGLRGSFMPSTAINGPIKCKYDK